MQLMWYCHLWKALRRSITPTPSVQIPPTHYGAWMQNGPYRVMPNRTKLSIWQPHRLRVVELNFHDLTQEFDQFQLIAMDDIAKLGS